MERPGAEGRGWLETPGALRSPRARVIVFRSKNGAFAPKCILRGYEFRGKGYLSRVDRFVLLFAVMPSNHELKSRPANPAKNHLQAVDVSDHPHQPHRLSLAVHFALPALRAAVAVLQAGERDLNVRRAAKRLSSVAPVPGRRRCLVIRLSRGATGPIGAIGASRLAS